MVALVLMFQKLKLKGDAMSETITKDSILFGGFDRVVINEEGEAVSPERALAMGIKPTVGFLRDDGWSLGAPHHLEMVAFKLWVGQWTHKIERPNYVWQAL